MASGKNVSSSVEPESLENVIDSLICAKVMATFHVYQPLVSESIFVCYLFVHYLLYMFGSYEYSIPYTNLILWDNILKININEKKKKALLA